MKQHPLPTRFDNIVALYYPVMYRLAAELSLSPFTAVALTQRVFRGNRTRLSRLRRTREIKAVLKTALFIEAIRRGPVRS